MNICIHFVSKDDAGKLCALCMEKIKLEITPSYEKLYAEIYPSEQAGERELKTVMHQSLYGVPNLRGLIKES